MLTKENMSDYVGKVAVFTVNKMAFHVRVTGCRVAYNQPELEVTPSAGTGSAWIRNFDKLGEI